MSEDRYHFVARVIHWIMALGFIFMWCCGYAMTTLVEDDSALEELLYELHISTGVTLLFLLIARIAARLIYSVPPLPEVISRIERLGAHFGHAALYVLPLVVITIGWAEVDFGGHEVTWFGLALPDLLPTVETWRGFDVGDVTELLHMWLAYTMLGVAVVHVAAVVKHRWFDRHDVLHRMTFGKK